MRRTIEHCEPNTAFSSISWSWSISESVLYLAVFRMPKQERGWTRLDIIFHWYISWLVASAFPCTSCICRRRFFATLIDFFQMLIKVWHSTIISFSLISGSWSNLQTRWDQREETDKGAEGGCMISVNPVTKGGCVHCCLLCGQMHLEQSYHSESIKVLGLSAVKPDTCGSSTDFLCKDTPSE